MEEQTKAFLDGFNEVAPLEWLRYFDEKELEVSPRVGGAGCVPPFLPRSPLVGWPFGRLPATQVYGRPSHPGETSHVFYEAADICERRAGIPL